MEHLVKTFIALALLHQAEVSWSQTRNTVPQAPKTKKAPELAFMPGVQIPENPEKYVWKVTNKVRGKEVSTGPVKVFTFDSLGWRYEIGSIPAGTEVELNTVRLGGQTHYYAIPWKGFATKGKDKNKPLTKAWINGNFIQATAKKAK